MSPNLPAIAAPGKAPRPGYSLPLAAALFVGIFAVLQWGWSELRGTAVERWVIDTMTVGNAAKVIATLDPAVGVSASGSRLVAPGGGINVLNGCEGIEVAFLLFSALVVAPLSWRERLLGIAAGTIAIFALNQARIVALFYAFRNDRVLFDTLHGMVTPLLMVVGAALFFAFWLRRGHRLAGSAAAE